MTTTLLILLAAAVLVAAAMLLMLLVAMFEPLPGSDEDITVALDDYDLP
jgi:hypothetical protein